MGVRMEASAFVQVFVHVKRTGLEEDAKIVSYAVYNFTIIKTEILTDSTTATLQLFVIQAAFMVIV